MPSDSAKKSRLAVDRELLREVRAEAKRRGFGDKTPSALADLVLRAWLRSGSVPGVPPEASAGSDESVLAARVAALEARLALVDQLAVRLASLERSRLPGGSVEVSGALVDSGEPAAMAPFGTKGAAIVVPSRPLEDSPAPRGSDPAPGGFTRRKKGERKLTGNALAALGALAKSPACQKSGWSADSLAEWGERAGLPKTAMQSAEKALVRRGLVERRGQGKKMERRPTLTGLALARTAGGE